MALELSLEQAQTAEGMHREWAYNCLDVTGTREVWDVLHSRPNSRQALFYAFERALQAPAMTIMRRGIRVDRIALGDAIRSQTAELRRTEKEVSEREDIKAKWDLQELRTGECKQREGKKHRWERFPDDDPRKVCKDCGAGRWQPKPFNCNSRQQVEHLFHDLLGVPYYKNRKGEVSYDEEVLERIGRKHPEHKPIVDAILEVRGHKKQLGFLGSRLGSDGRMYHSVNVGAAWTGRFSASKNPYGLGTNLQNIAERWRHIFVADPGWEIFYADLEQAESRTVAYLADDERYIEAHLSGDTHTYVCRLVWPDLPWTGDLDRDKVVAKALPPWDEKPGHEYRFQAKRFQHGCNYGLQPHGIAAIAHIPLKVAKHAYEAYHTAFPGIQGNYHKDVRRRIEEGLPIVNPFGREITLFGRPWDPHTFKQGLAAGPQSTIVDALDIGMYRVWKEMDPERAQLLAQIHDAILGQRRPGDDATAKRVVELMTFPIPIGDRVMTIPVEFMAGRTWGKKDLSVVHV